MIKVGKRTVVASFPQLQIPVGEELSLEIPVFDWQLKLQIAFEDAGTEQHIKLVPIASDSVRLVFQGWNNSLGTSLQAPAGIAQLQAGGNLEFLAANYRIGNTNLLSLQFMHNPEAT